MTERRTDRSAREADRIRGVYARRATRGLDRRYSPFEPAHLFQSQSLERALLATWRREGWQTLAGRRILDVGCGSGSWLAGLTRYSATPADLVGVELRSEAFQGASDTLALVLAAGDSLPFPNQTFDMVSQLTMMSSVLDPEVRESIARELRRVLRPEGFVLWYDFTVNPLNCDAHGIGRKELGTLFPDCWIDAQRVTLAPPITRSLAGRFWLGCELLNSVSLLRTHLLATIRPSRRRSAV